MLLFFLFQVNDFLAGKSPLTLAMRLGDHMMFVQLQLSTSQSSSKRTTSSSSSSKHRSAKHAGGVSSSSTSSQLRHQANVPHLQQQKQQTVPLYVSPPQVSPSNSISSTSPLGTGSKVVVPVPVHAQPRSTSHPYAACYPNNNNPSLEMPADAGAAPQIASGLNAPKPASGVTAPKPTKADGATPVLDSTALVEASRNLSQKLKELSAASSTHIKTPIEVKQKKVTNIANISFFCYQI